MKTETDLIQSQCLSDNPELKAEILHRLVAEIKNWINKVGSMGEQTLIGFISVDNNAQRLCNLCANLPEERLNSKIPALRPAKFLCWTASLSPHIFLAACHCVDFIMLFFSPVYFLFLKQQFIFSYTFL